MTKRLGILFIVLGIICIIAAIGFVLHNKIESNNAKVLGTELLEQAKGEISKLEKTEPALKKEEALKKEMATVKVGEYECIGVLSLPAINFQMPVLTDWSYEKLESAPCLYFGSYYEKNFVIAAHNYPAHFSKLSQLQAGDIVVFTDVYNVERYYEVILTETLPATAVNEMISAGFDLSLYTCTPGGANRVTVRCNLVKAP